MNIGKRVRALAVGGAAALMLAGVATVSQHATHVSALLPTQTALGCANANDAGASIQFPFNTALVTPLSQTQTNVIAGVTVAPPLLSITNPTGVVECGMVLVDNDGDPTTVDGGTITYNVLGLGAVPFGTGNPLGVTIGQILESNGPQFSVACGGVVAEGCQGAVLTGGPVVFAASPFPSNVIHVGLRQGTTFPLVGGGSPIVQLSATYLRAPSLGGGTVNAPTITIGIAQPAYTMILTNSAGTIPAAAGTGTGDVITASMFRITAIGCVPVALGAVGAIQTSAIFTVCPAAAFAGVGPGFINTPTTGVTAAALNGSEPGVITFVTNSGVFGNPATTASNAQQTVSVHCGEAATFNPVIFTPIAGNFFNFSFSSCQSVTATLYGGGAAGTATVLANFVGDFTGATAQAATTVILSATSPTVALSRGCNEVITPSNTAANTPIATIVGLVQPNGIVVSVWMFNNSLHAFQAGYFNVAGAPTDFSTVNANQSLFICVSAAGTFPAQNF